MVTVSSCRRPSSLAGQRGAGAGPPQAAPGFPARTRLAEVQTS